MISRLASADQPDQLLLTFTFEWPHPEVSGENREEVKKLEEKYAGMGRQVVPHTVDVARRMKDEGRLN